VLRPDRKNRFSVRRAIVARLSLRARVWSALYGGWLLLAGAAAFILHYIILKKSGF
jgi:hypothetical protein